MNFEKTQAIPVSRTDGDEYPQEVEEGGRGDGGECVPVGSEPLSDLSDDEKIERAAERILEEYLAAFEELAK